MVAEYADKGGTLTLRRSYVHGLQYTSPLTSGRRGASLPGARRPGRRRDLRGQERAL